MAIMRMVGLEPTRGRPRKILSLVRLPFRHIRKSCPNNSYFSSRKLFYHTCLEIATLFYDNFSYLDSGISTQEDTGVIGWCQTPVALSVKSFTFSKNLIVL